MKRIAATALAASVLVLMGSAPGHAERARVIPAKGKVTFSTTHYTKDGITNAQTSFKAHTTFWWCGTYGFGVKGKMDLTISKGAASKVLDTWTSDPKYATKCGHVSVGDPGSYTLHMMLGKASLASGTFSIHK